QLAQARPVLRVVAVRRFTGQAEPVQQFGVELGFQGPDRHVLSVGGFVDVVEGGSGVEQVGAAFGAPAAGGEHPVDHHAQVGGSVHYGRVHHLSAPASAGFQQGGQDPDGQVHAAAAEVPEQVDRHLGWSALPA